MQTNVGPHTPHLDCEISCDEWCPLSQSHKPSTPSWDLEPPKSCREKTIIYTYISKAIPLLKSHMSRRNVNRIPLFWSSKGYLWKTKQNKHKASVRSLEEINIVDTHKDRIAHHFVPSSQAWRKHFRENSQQTCSQRAADMVDSSKKCLFISLSFVIPSIFLTYMMMLLCQFSRNTLFYKPILQPSKIADRENQSERALIS